MAAWSTLEVTLFDLVRICQHAPDGFVVLQRVAGLEAKSPAWNPGWAQVAARVAARFETRPTLDENLQRVPDELFEAFLGALTLTVYENPYDGVLRDSRRCEGDAPLGLLELHRKYGTDAVYRVLEAGACQTNDAPRAALDELANQPLSGAVVPGPRRASNDE